jgi:hypothetical protein
MMKKKEVKGSMLDNNKLAQLEDATAAAQSILSIKESELTYASEALSIAKSKLRSLNSEAQQTLLCPSTTRFLNLLNDFKRSKRV